MEKTYKVIAGKDGEEVLEVTEPAIKKYHKDILLQEKARIDELLSHFD